MSGNRKPYTDRTIERPKEKPWYKSLLSSNGAAEESGPIDYPSAEKVFQEEEPLLHYHIIHRGLVKTGNTKSSKDILLDIKGPGELIERNLSKEGKMERIVFAQTVTPAQLIPIRTATFFRYMEKEFWFSKEILGQLEAETSFLFNLKTLSQGIGMRAQLPFLLNQLWRKWEKARRGKKEGRIPPLPLSQMDLAKFLGVSRETVFFYLKDLREREIVKANHEGIEVKDKEGLREIFEGFI